MSKKSKIVPSQVVGIDTSDKLKLIEDSMKAQNENLRYKKAFEDFQKDL